MKKTTEKLKSNLLIEKLKKLEIKDIDQVESYIDFLLARQYSDEKMSFLFLKKAC